MSAFEARELKRHQELRQFLCSSSGYSHLFCSTLPFRLLLLFGQLSLSNLIILSNLNSTLYLKSFHAFILYEENVCPTPL